jgi:hypothetical protein
MVRGRLAVGDAGTRHSAVEGAVVCIHGIDKRGCCPLFCTFRIGCIGAPLHNLYASRITFAWTCTGRDGGCGLHVEKNKKEFDLEL